jgi:hypothetical protein
MMSEVVANGLILLVSRRLDKKEMDTMSKNDRCTALWKAFRFGPVVQESLRKPAMKWAVLCAVVTVLALSGAGMTNTEGISAAEPAQTRPYVILAWNDLGMHCYNPDFQDLAVLPPYNNLWAQVIKVGDPPQIVTTGITVQYRIYRNIYSAGKTNFWTYAQDLFNLPQPLPPNVGLAGKGLSGTMDLVGDHFEAEGIPLTEYIDSLAVRPYQIAIITARDSTSGAILARNAPVAPVSSELRCDICHSDTGFATLKYGIVPTGKVETNILTLHDLLAGHNYPVPLMDRRPVLCAECHGSNALGLPGQPTLPNLSNAVHGLHGFAAPIPNTTDGCYYCHPGPETRCLRDVHSQVHGMGCLNCHGDMRLVASNPQPWLNEPRCDNADCHPAYVQDQPLYRFSRAHGGIYCAGCHDSPHAIAPSREKRDNLKFMYLQNDPGYLKTCTVCHATNPIQPWQHNLLP